MKLLYTVTSPIARKCRIIARELNLMDKIEEVITTTRSEDALIMKNNPNGMVPTLETDEGFNIVESMAICNYLEKQSNNKEFIPQDETKYWQIYALDSIASQTFESIVSRARERIYKPEEFHYPDGIKHEQGRAERTLDLLEKESPNYIDKFNKLHVTIGLCGLVLDNVFPNEEWKNNRNNLVSIYENFVKRDSFVETIIKKD
jgi:glutathione S-transferase|tara:strand:+ start:1530 stop:2138 length:609 start_codon:yes stop_codon:yes gene_type:complete